LYVNNIVNYDLFNVDDASYDADSEGSSSGSHFACNTMEMPIEGTVVPPLLQQEVSCTYILDTLHQSFN